MENKYHIRKKTLWGKEKFLVTSKFSFSQNVFHSYIFLLHQNAVLCGNGLKKRNTWLYMLFHRKAIENIAAKGDKETAQYIFMLCYKSKAIDCTFNVLEVFQAISVVLSDLIIYHRKTTFDSPNGKILLKTLLEEDFVKQRAPAKVTFTPNMRILSLLFTTQSRLLMIPGKKPFENIVRKGENAGTLVPSIFFFSHNVFYSI